MHPIINYESPFGWYSKRQDTFNTAGSEDGRDVESGDKKDEECNNEANETNN